MKLDLDFNIKGLDGKDMDGTFDQVHAGALIGNVLGFSPAQSTLTHIRRFYFAQELYAKKPIEVTKDDVNQIKIIINDPQSKLLTVTIAQVTEVIDELTD